ncbi:MAG TPA: STAS domain-containing protein [Candidatus Udaeobacter sp.]|nr:STAS domain-containing protein [Candidatus Udaeobacter sp.]
MRIQQMGEIPGGVILSIDGDLYGGPHADEFYALIRDLIMRGKKLVLVDLTRARRANSSGLGILVRGYALLKDAGGALRVFNLSDGVDHMFKITRFNSIIEVYENEAEARAGRDGTAPTT